MKNNREKVLYVAKSDGKGVENKIQGFCNAVARAGYHVELDIEQSAGFAAINRQIRKMISSDAKYIVMRSPTRNSIFFVLCFIWLRLQGKTLIIDQPSPASTYIKEVNYQDRSFINKTAKKLLTYIGCPFTFMLAHRVVEYGIESSYFRFFSGNRELVIGNGIDTARISLRKNDYPDGTELLSMIGVGARIESWHGFDRVVRAMGEWKKQGRKPRVVFDLVGDPRTLHVNEIKELIKIYGLEDDVRFLGSQPADALTALYDKESLAISSLANFRRGLYNASVLKSREYCLAGIPFVSADEDPDFPTQIPFRFAIPNDNSIDAIINIFESFAERRKQFTDEDIRQYAIDHLSFDVKFREIMKGL